MTKWKKPKKVKIGSLTYKIHFVTPGKGRELKEREAGCLSQDKQLIEIDKNSSDQMILLILMHEILHGIGDAMVPNKSPFAKETFTCIVAELLLQALQSSKLLPTLSSDLPHRNPCRQKGKK